MSRTEIAGFCTLCRSRCGTINTIEDGKLVQVRNDPSHPTGKATCLKGRAAPEIAHSARRLATPLRRTAPKGAEDPRFVPISWDEALDTISARLQQIRADTGPESVAFSLTSPSSSSISDAHEWVWRFIRSFGSPNAIFSTELCNWHKDYAHAFTFGCAMPTADYRNTDLVLLWGHNPSNVWLAQAEAIGAAQARGARLVIVDPRRTAMTAKADLWLRVKPGTDGALAMGVSREMIKRGLINQDFVRTYTNAALLVREDNGRFLRARDMGNTDRPDDYLVWSVNGQPAPADGGADHSFLFDVGPRDVRTVDGIVHCRTAFEKFSEAVEPFDPLSLEHICGVSRKDVSAFAEMMGNANSIAYHAWTGVGQHTNATQTERSIATLYALTDAFDKPGGNVRHPAHPVPKLHDISMIPENVRKKALGLDKRPLGPPAEGWITGSDFYDAVLEKKPYQVRALFSFGANLLVSQPNLSRGREALKELEFHVHCNIFMNPSAEFADIVLPVSVPWENDALRVGFEISHEAQEHIQFRPRMMERLGESRSDTEIIFALAKRLGLSDVFFDGDIEAANNFLLKPLGLTVDELRANPGGIRLSLPKAYQKYRTGGFATETKRVELYSEKLLRHGYPPVPTFVPPYESTDEFPLAMFSANSGYFCHSQHRGITTLRARRPDPVATVHPLTADRYGITDGDWMKVTTRRGEFQIRAVVDDTVSPEMLASDYGWWEPANDLGLSEVGTSPFAEMATYNQVIPDDVRDPVSGGLPLRSTRCRIEKLALSSWHGTKPFIVREKRQITPDTVSLELATTDKRPVPKFLPGQSISVGLAGGKRSYSLTSGVVTENRDSFTIAVKRVDQGQVSPLIFGKLQTGDTVQLGAPSGRFIVPERNEFPVVLIAGGIGITPFMSYLRSAPEKSVEAPPRIVLLYYCRDVENTAFFEELDVYTNRHPKLDIRLYVEGGPTVKFGRGVVRAGRFSPEHIDQWLFDSRARFYICGVGAMITAVTAGLRARGVPAFEIFSERFISPITNVSTNLSPRKVTFARSGKTLTWAPEVGSLLALAEKSGLTVQSGCRVGQCESCVTKVLSGSVMHMSEVELAEDGACLTCLSMPTSDVVLDA